MGKRQMLRDILERFSKLGMDPAAYTIVLIPGNYVLKSKEKS